MSELKFGRNYSITFTGTDFTEALVISLPITIEFDITRNTLTSANVCQIRLYNLSVQHRNLLRKNVTSAGGNPFIYLTLRGGYGINLPIIFSGAVSQGWSSREGVNFITQLECYDGGFAFINGQTNLTVPAGTPYQSVIATLISSLPNVRIGAVGSYPGVTPKQTTYSGNTTEILRKLTGKGFYIDNGVGNALGNGEYSVSGGPPFVINAASGLLNTPMLEQNIIRFDIMFEPSLTVGSAIDLQSITNPALNGLYSVASVKHRGTISQVVSGDAITTAEFFSTKLQTPVGTYGTH